MLSSEEKTNLSNYFQLLYIYLSDGMLTLLLNFVFKNGQKVFDVINVCCCCLILPFVSARVLNIVISHQSSASLLHWVICFGGYLFVHTLSFWILDFLGFSLCSSFGRRLCRNCGWAGWEPYVRSHTTEPPCYTLSFVLISFFDNG